MCWCASHRLFSTISRQGSSCVPECAMVFASWCLVLFGFGVLNEAKTRRKVQQIARRQLSNCCSYSC